MVSALICGSKLWVYEKREPVIKWLQPRLEKVIENINNDSEKNWSFSISSITSSCEPRMVAWLIEMLFKMIKKPSDNAFQINM